MTETKHTCRHWSRGPVHIVPEAFASQPLDAVFELSEGDDGFLVAVILNKDYGDIVAAAPELLEALEQMMEKYGGMYDEWQEVELRAKSAIAKAKGETT